MSFWTKICSLFCATILITSCTYNPVVDYRGSEKQGADLERFDDDVSSCKELAKQTIPEEEHKVEAFFLLPQDTQRAIITKKCLTGRGWSVVH